MLLVGGREYFTWPRCWLYISTDGIIAVWYPIMRALFQSCAFYFTLGLTAVAVRKFISFSQQICWYCWGWIKLWCTCNCACGRLIKTYTGDRTDFCLWKLFFCCVAILFSAFKQNAVMLLVLCLKLKVPGQSD